MSAQVAGARRVAMLMHSMQDGDRAWLLTQLPDAERAPLTTMLAELRNLGLPAAPELLKEAIRDADTRTAAPAVPQPGDEVSNALAWLHELTSERVVGLVGHEPPALIAALLALGPWPWQPALLAQLGAVPRREVGEWLVKRPTCPKRLGEQLLALMFERLRAGAGDALPVQDLPAAAAPSGSKLRRLYDLVRQRGARTDQARDVRFAPRKEGTL